MPNQDRKKPHVTHEAHISGSISGQVHTGSGDINIHTSYTSSGGEIFTKDDFLAALVNFRQELEIAYQKDLSRTAFDTTTIEVEEATREANKSQPDPKGIIQHLENVKGILASGTGVATTAAVSADKLIPIVENIIHSVSKIFHI